MFEMFERGDPNKMYIIIGQQRWLVQHAEEKDGGWYCLSTGAKIKLKIVGRTIWQDMLNRKCGTGEVRKVTHFYCPVCEREPQIELGTPIYGVELKALDPTPDFHEENKQHDLDVEYVL